MIYTDRKNGEQLEYTINAQRKTAIKKLFARAFNLAKNTATLNDIKKAFPNLNFKKPISWCTVAAECLEKIEAAELTPYQELENATAALPGNLYRSSIRTFAGSDCDIYDSKHNINIGTVGYSLINGTWYYMLKGRLSRLMPTANCQDAINGLLMASGKIAKVA